MGKSEKRMALYQQLKRSRHNVSFGDLCTLAEMVGFTFDRQNGTSHKIYRHSKHPGIMNFQDVKGQAKPKQIGQLIDFIDEHGLLEKEVQNV